MNRNGEIIVTDEQGRERERYGVVYGAKLLVRDGQKVEPNALLAEWDPVLDADHHRGGRPREVRRPHRRRHDQRAGGRDHRPRAQGRSSPRRIPDARPRISIKDADGKTRKLANSEADARYMLPEGANLVVNDGDEVDAGDVLAKMPRETTKTKDITGGLPRVAELFEARKPKEHAVISEIDGVVAFGKDTKGKRKVVVTPEVDGKLRPDLAKEYLIGKGKHISVHTGDRVRAGEALMDGAANPHDILRVLGEKELARWLVDEVQEVYRLQGVKINDKHIETIVRQMLRRVRIVDVGDTNFLADEQVEKFVFEAENERVLQAEGRPASGRAAAARHHQGLALDRVVHLGVLLPGDDEGAHRGRHQRQGRLPARPEGERHHGPAHPRRHRAHALQAPRHRGGDARGRGRGGGGGARRGRRGVGATTRSVPSRARSLLGLGPFLFDPAHESVSDGKKSLSGAAEGAVRRTEALDRARWARKPGAWAPLSPPGRRTGNAVRVVVLPQSRRRQDSPLGSAAAPFQSVLMLIS